MADLTQATPDPKQPESPETAHESPTQQEKITLDRLDKQIDWYDRRSRTNRALYKALKSVTIGSAAIIPVLTASGTRGQSQMAGALGVLIAILEGLQQLNQFQSNWTIYRATAEALKHEKYFYLGQAGPYLKGEEAHALLAERVESLVSDENAKWFMSLAASRIPLK